jgi:hypothetical protein
MSDRIIIKCIISSSVSIDDLGVHLAGIGSTSIVFAASASASKDLKNAIRNKWVVLQQLGEDVKIWPLSGFRETPKVPPTPSENHDSSMIRLLGDINNNLKELLERPIPPAPEVLAAHVRSLSSMPVVPPGLPGGGSLPGIGSSNSPISHPQFIPSQLVPDVNVDDIHVTEETSDRGIDASVDALRKARRKS